MQMNTEAAKADSDGDGAEQINCADFQTAQNKIIDCQTHPQKV